MMPYRYVPLVLLLFLAACAHGITIVPDPSTVPEAGTAKSSKNVAYYLAKADKDQQVTTPGGGGDTVSYYPVRDLEHGIFRVLSGVFDRVYTLPARDDLNFLATNGIAFVFEPTVTSDSSSSNVLIWPPTDFTVSIAVKAYDLDRKLIWERTVVGKGKATAGELMSNFSLSANRAASDALKQLQGALAAEPVFRP
jgi:hypothetical protein